MFSPLMTPTDPNKHTQIKREPVGGQRERKREGLLLNDLYEQAIGFKRVGAGHGLFESMKTEKMDYCILKWRTQT